MKITIRFKLLTYSVGLVTATILLSIFGMDKVTKSVTNQDLKIQEIAKGWVKFLNLVSKTQPLPLR